MAKEAKQQAKHEAAAEKAREELMAAVAEAEQLAEEGIAELAQIVAATVHEGEDADYDVDDADVGVYDEDDVDAAGNDVDALVPPLRVPTTEDKKPARKVNRPMSARAARLSKLTESELLPPRPHSARAVSEAASKAAAAAAAKRRAAAAAAAGLLKRDAAASDKTSGASKRRQRHHQANGKGPPGTTWMKPPVPKFRVRKMPPVPSFPSGANASGWPYRKSSDDGGGGGGLTSPKGNAPGGAGSGTNTARGDGDGGEAAAAASAAAALETALPFESADMLDKYRILERLLAEQKREAAAREARAIKLAMKERELHRLERERRDAARRRDEEEAARATHLRETARRREEARLAEEARVRSAEEERVAVQLATRQRFAVVDVGDPAPNGLGGRATAGAAVTRSPPVSSSGAELRSRAVCGYVGGGGGHSGGATSALTPAFNDERQAVAEHKALQRARLEAIERRERAVYEDAVTELNELRISKARDQRAAAVLAAQERRAALNDERAAEHARRREATARREAEEAAAARSQMEMKLSTVGLRRAAIEEAQTEALRRRAAMQDEAHERAALARKRAEADNAEWRARTAKKRQEKFSTAEAKVGFRLLGESLGRGAKLEAAEDLHALRMRELSRREMLRADRVRERIRREEEKAQAIRERRDAVARRQKMRVEDRVFGHGNPSDTAGGLGGALGVEKVGGGGGVGTGNRKGTAAFGALPTSASRVERIFQEAAAKNQGLEELRDELRARMEEDSARAAEASLNAGVPSCDPKVAEAKLNGGGDGGDGGISVSGGDGGGSESRGDGVALASPAPSARNDALESTSTPGDAVAG